MYLVGTRIYIHSQFASTHHSTKKCFISNETFFSQIFSFWGNHPKTYILKISFHSVREMDVSLDFFISQHLFLFNLLHGLTIQRRHRARSRFLFFTPLFFFLARAPPFSSFPFHRHSFHGSRASVNSSLALAAPYVDRTKVRSRAVN